MALAGLFGGGLLAVPGMARASEEGRRNTALGLGAAAAYLLITQKNKVPGIAAAAGAAYAYKRYEDARNDRRRQDRYGAYDYRSDRWDDRCDRDRYESSYDDSYRRDRWSRTDNRYSDRWERRRDRRDDCDNDRYYRSSRR